VDPNQDDFRGDPKGRNDPGDYQHGISYAPQDVFPARLHQGGMALLAEVARDVQRLPGHGGG
jgi:hypothetical protein